MPALTSNIRKKTLVMPVVSQMTFIGTKNTSGEPRWIQQCAVVALKPPKGVSGLATYTLPQECNKPHLFPASWKS